jgi:hypothetical protein
MAQNRLRPTVIATVTALVAAIAVLVWWIREVGTRAEYGLHAVRVASRAAETYVRRNGAWPTSWADLESVPVTDDPLLSWPRDSEQIRSYVEIDFSLTVEGVSNEDPDEFVGIRPRVAAYTLYRDAFRSLVEAAKEKAAER